MARVNVGISPTNLTDQHLIAESVEITMITGALRSDGYKIKGKVPLEFCLGTGHINFFKPRITYLQRRLIEVNAEMVKRGFNPSTRIDLDEFETRGCKTEDWQPKFTDTVPVRLRVIERLKNPLKAKAGFHKYYGQPIENMDEFCEKIKTNKLFYV